LPAHSAAGAADALDEGGASSSVMPGLLSSVAGTVVSSSWDLARFVWKLSKPHSVRHAIGEATFLHDRCLVAAEGARDWGGHFYKIKRIVFYNKAKVQQ